MKLFSHFLVVFSLSVPGIGHAQIAPDRDVSLGSARSTWNLAKCAVHSKSKRVRTKLIAYVENHHKRRLLLELGERVKPCLDSFGAGRELVWAGYMAGLLVPKDADLSVLGSSLQMQFPSSIVAEKEAIVCALNEAPADILKLFSYAPGSNDELTTMTTIAQKADQCWTEEAKLAFQSPDTYPIIRAHLALAAFAGTEPSN
ncbi:hypothetical protein [Parasphingorhabdus sp.]|uniref:hypothetical protein n=1 Tax=Parasphingorhabdus sp. TaxID=2709688 RepID=UPI003D2E772E